MIKQNKNVDKEIKNLEDLFEKNPKDINIIINLANAYISSGNFISALKITKLANQLAPENMGIDFTLSNLIDYSEDHEHQKIMLEKSDNEFFKEKDKIPLYFALGKSFNDQKKYSKSFHFFELGNKIKNSTLKDYSLKVEELYVKKIKKFFLNYDFKTTYEKKLFNKKIIFIIGLPRSGSSLVHQILASHSSVNGLGESSILNTFINNKILEEKFETNLKYNNNINHEFLSDLSIYLGSEYENVSKNKISVDKSLFNFFWIGFIKVIFPKAKIIHTTRNMEDTCFSIYKSLFGKNSVLWSYDKKNILKFISIYNDLLKFWSDKIPNYIYNLSYESLINNQKKEIKKLLSFCELEWEENCINFYKNAPPIKSASLYQTRKPIYKSSIKQNLKYNSFINFGFEKS